MALTPFPQASYLAQVRRLRKLANLVLKEFSIGPYELFFIHHGENATFKVSSQDADYLLRIHRNNYHSKAAIMDELAWLQFLSGSSEIPVQMPLISQSGELVVEAIYEGVGVRYCTLLQWQPGVIKRRGLGKKHFERMGALAAKLHDSSIHKRANERDYWSAEGLLGAKATLGPVLKLKEIVTPLQFKTLKECQSMVKRKLTRYEKLYPHRSALIHADLHFGNVLWREGYPYPIDFDDCGVGAYMYDLAVMVYSTNFLYGPANNHLARQAQEQILAGYSTVRPIDAADRQILPYYLVARKLALIGWLYERKDHPKLFAFLKKQITPDIKYLRKFLVEGHQSFLNI